MILTLKPKPACLLLFVAGLLEIGWSISMKASHGFTRHQYTAIAFAVAWLSSWLLGLALRQPFAVWTGIGAVGAMMLGIVVFGESFTAPRSWLHCTQCVRHPWVEAT